MRMGRVIIESPFAGDVEANRAYLQECIRDCIARGESPYASHQMLTTALDDTDEAQRNAGIEAGYAWWAVADEIVFYTDLGWSRGMNRARAEIERRLEYGLDVPWWSERKIRPSP